MHERFSFNMDKEAYDPKANNCIPIFLVFMECQTYSFGQVKARLWEFYFGWSEQ